MPVRPAALVLLLTLSPLAAWADLPPHQLDGALGTAVIVAPGTMLSGRFGFEFFGFLTVSLRAFGILGASSQAWGAFPELRLHYPGHLVKPYLTVATGVAQVLAAPSPADGSVHFALGLFLATSLGVAIELGQFDLGAEGGIQVYADGFHATLFPDGTFRAMPAGVALFTFGYRFPKRGWFDW